MTDKEEIEKLKLRIKELEEINKEHQIINGELREKLEKLKKWGVLYDERSFKNI